MNRSFLNRGLADLDPEVGKRSAPRSFARRTLWR
jgi:hypothetical protein